MLNYLTSAAEKFPDNEDVLLNLFFMHVRRCDFNAQQAIARKLLQKKPSDKSLRFTMAVSTMMQGENDSKLAKRMFLPLAERLLEKALKDGIFDSHTELQLYLSILKMQEKYSEALDVLRKADKIGMYQKLSCSSHSNFSALNAFVFHPDLLSRNFINISFEHVLFFLI